MDVQACAGSVRWTTAGYPGELDSWTAGRPGELDSWTTNSWKVRTIVRISSWTFRLFAGQLDSSWAGQLDIQDEEARRPNNCSVFPKSRSPDVPTCPVCPDGIRIGTKRLCHGHVPNVPIPRSSLPKAPQVYLNKITASSYRQLSSFRLPPKE